MTIVAAVAPSGVRGRLVRRTLARLGGLALVLWAAATITFFAMRAIPGDPALAVLGGPGSQASEAALAAARAEYGFDQPLWMQYARQLGRYLTGDLGASSSLHAPVAAVIGEQLGSTLVLTMTALVLAWAIALGLATWAARGGRVADAVGSGLEIVAAAVPHFWLGTVLVLVFASGLGVLPAVSTPGPLGLVLPTVTLAVPLAGFLGQVMREPLAEALRSPFALSAAARGESRLGLVRRHALRHAALPAIGLSGWAFGSLLSGAVVVETVFARPGLGRSLLRAVQDRDILLVSGIVLVAALGYCVATAAADVLESIADPRSRKGAAP